MALTRQSFWTVLIPLGNFRRLWHMLLWLHQQSVLGLWWSAFDIKFCLNKSGTLLITCANRSCPIPRLVDQTFQSPFFWDPVARTASKFHKCINLCYICWLPAVLRCFNVWTVKFCRKSGQKKFQLISQRCCHEVRGDGTTGQHHGIGLFNQPVFMCYLLVHDVPSPVNVSLHLQENPPTWFMHVPFALQLWPSDEHSSISGLHTWRQLYWFVSFFYLHLAWSKQLKINEVLKNT